MRTIDFSADASHSDIMRQFHRNGWWIIRAKWTRSASGDRVFRLWYVEVGK